MMAFRINREEFRKQLSNGKLRMNAAVGRGMTLSRIKGFLTSFYSRDASTFQLKNSVLQRQALWPIPPEVDGGGEGSRRGAKRARDAQTSTKPGGESRFAPAPSNPSISPSKSLTTSHSTDLPQDPVGKLHNTRRSAAKAPAADFSSSFASQPHTLTPKPNPSPINNIQAQGSSATSRDSCALGSSQVGQTVIEGNPSEQFRELIKLSEGWLTKTKCLDDTYKDAQVKISATMSDFETSLTRIADLQREQATQNSNFSQNQAEVNSKVLQTLDATVAALKNMEEHSAERISKSLESQLDLGRKEMLDSTSKNIEAIKTLIQQQNVVPAITLPIPSPLEANANATQSEMVQNALPLNKGDTPFPTQGELPSSSPHMGHPQLPTQVQHPPQIGHSPLPPQMGHTPLPAQVGQPPLPPQIGNTILPLGHTPLPPHMNYAPLPPQMGHAPAPSQMCHAPLLSSQISHTPLPPQMGHAPLTAQMGYASLPPQMGHAHVVSQVGHAPLPLVTQMGHNFVPPQTGYNTLASQMFYSPLSTQVGYPASSQMAHTPLAPQMVNAFNIPAQTSPHAQLWTPQMGYTCPSNPVMSYGGDAHISVFPCLYFEKYGTRFLISLLIVFF